MCSLVDRGSKNWLWFGWGESRDQWPIEGVVEEEEEGQLILTF
jgi:hypothetical protein